MGSKKTYRFTKEHDVGLDEALAAVTSCNLFLLDVFPHQLVAVLSLAVDAPLSRKASVRLNNLVIRDACKPLESVDVLREAL